MSEKTKEKNWNSGKQTFKDAGNFQSPGIRKIEKLDRTTIKQKKDADLLKTDNKKKSEPAPPPKEKKESDDSKAQVA